MDTPNTQNNDIWPVTAVPFPASFSSFPSTSLPSPPSALPSSDNDDDHFNRFMMALFRSSSSLASSTPLPPSPFEIALPQPTLFPQFAMPPALNLSAVAASASASSAEANSTASVMHMRLALTITHLLLVSLGSVNLLVILVILLRPYMRSITNVYMISLCLADFIYLTNLTLVAASQLNDKSWPFNSILCTMYHGTETTGKYASVFFVVLLAVDRYCAMCRSNWCARYRNYRTAMALSLAAWLFAGVAASPLYYFAEVAFLRFRNANQVHKLCIAKWPNPDVARWYITVSSVFIFALPLFVIIFCYYHILNKLREALKSCKRLKRGASSRAPYHRVTRLVLWVVVFHVLCWSPFWLFNLFSSIFRLRINTQFDRVVVNIIHLFPYVNCALNPILYVAHAENFRVAFRSLFCNKLLARAIARRRSGDDDSRMVGGQAGAGGNGTTASSPRIGSSVMTINTNGITTMTGAGPLRGTLRHSSGSERALLSATTVAALSPTTNGSPPAIGCNGVDLASGGSAPSLLLDCPRMPMRANSAKHSVITIDDCSSDHSLVVVGGHVRPVVRQISWRRRSSSTCEQELLCGGGLAASSTVPFVTRVILADEEMPAAATTATTIAQPVKRGSLTAEKSLLDQINASEELPPTESDFLNGDDDETDRKRTSICFYNIGLAVGTIGGTALAEKQQRTNGNGGEEQKESERNDAKGGGGGEHALQADEGVEEDAGSADEDGDEFV